MLPLSHGSLFSTGYIVRFDSTPAYRLINIWNDTCFGRLIRDTIAVKFSVYSKTIVCLFCWPLFQVEKKALGQAFPFLLHVNIQCNYTNKQPSLSLPSPFAIYKMWIVYFCNSFLACWTQSFNIMYPLLLHTLPFCLDPTKVNKMLDHFHFFSTAVSIQWCLCFKLRVSV